MKRWSLHTYLGASLWIVAMVIVWGGAGLFHWWNLLRTEDQVRTMARAVASTVAIAVGERWTSETSVGLPTQLAARQEGVAFVKVRLASGGLRMSAGDPGIDPALVWVEHEPVTHFNQTLGMVEVGVYRAAGADLTRPWAVTTLVISFAATALTTGVAYYVTDRTVRPLKVLRKVAVQWDRPLEEDPTQLSAPRELMELATGLVTMRQHALATKLELEEEVSSRTSELAAACTRLEATFQQVTAALAKALDARDTLTACHANRTAELAGRIAERLGIEEEERRTLVLAATLHDVGKIGVPEGVLLKPGPLTEAERALMQQHSAIGADILQEVTDLAAVAQVVRCHHERWDGRGYPLGLKEEAIPYFSRIIGVADAVEAMCARRSYRGPLPAEAVLAEVRRCSGTQFDPTVVEQGWAEIEATVLRWTHPSSA